ncbi:MAG: hypothetical protein ACJ8IR_08875 [Alphaproteobacteria bacterium]
MNFGTTTEPTVAMLVIKNVGTTPAYETATTIKIAYVVGPFGNKTPDVKMSPEHASVLTIGPEAEATMSAPTFRPMTQQEVDAIRTHAAGLLVWGSIDYVDAFHLRHRTQFRLTFGGDGPVEGGKLRPDATGNSAT